MPRALPIVRAATAPGSERAPSPRNPLGDPAALKARGLDPFADIFAARLPSAPLHALRVSGSDASRDIQIVLRRAGIRSVRVRRGRGTAWRYVDLILPALVPEAHSRDCLLVRAGHYDRERCAACLRRQAAHRRIAHLVAVALPYCEDRSDSQRDHYDFIFSIHD